MFCSEKVADFILSAENIPNEICRQAKNLMLDAVGVAYAGSQEACVASAIKAFSSLPIATKNTNVWGHNLKLDSIHSAMINGVSAHALDFDDTHTEAILHASAILAPLCLSYGFSVCSEGQKILKAFIVGWEVSSRIGIASHGNFHKSGFHTTAICGVFGATVACCVLLDLSFDQIVNALGIAGSYASGLNEFLSNGSDSKVIHIANSIQNGIYATLLAKNGIRGPYSIFEGRDNIFRAFGKANPPNLKHFFEDFGKHWQIMQVSLKPYPCCHFAHAFIESALYLRELGLQSCDIDRITCFVDEVPIGFICDPIERKYSPQTAYEAKFSMPFLMALMFIDGKINLDSYKNLSRQEVVNFAQKITYKKRQSKEFPKYFPALIEAVLYDKTTIVKEIPVNRGNFDNPLSIDEIHEKFKTNVKSRLSAQEVDDIISFIDTLERQHKLIF